MHAVAAAASRLFGKRRWNSLVERRSKHGCDVSVGLLKIDAAGLLIGYAVDEDICLPSDFLDRVLDHAWRDRQEGERIEQAGRRVVADVVADLLQDLVLP